MFRAKVTIAFFITVTSGEEETPQLGVSLNENAFLRGGINEEIKQITQ